MWKFSNIISFLAHHSWSKHQLWLLTPGNISFLKSHLILCHLKNIYFIDYAITVVPFFSSPLFPSALHRPPTRIPPSLSSCPWVIHISSLASPFPILFLTSPCLFCTYHLCFLYPVPFPPFSSLLLPLINLCVISISVICSCSSCLLSSFLFLFFFLGSVVDSSEYFVTLLVVFLIFFFLDKTL